MNYIATPRQPYLALIDDDAHSARLMTRMLLAHGGPLVQWIDGAVPGLAELGAIVSDRTRPRPGLVIVDLKASSGATRDFVASLRQLEGSGQLLVVAVSPSLDKIVRDTLLDAGADAVFQRHAEVEAYRREAASIVSFWVRNQHLDAIGS
jgi:CheY-like chemotaxis protein